jgi:hypothetical protein
MNPTRVEVTIDELVLHGFAPVDRYAIAEALEQELTRLLSAQGVPASFAQSGEAERLDGGSFTTAPDTKGKTVGTLAAQAVYHGVQA